MSDNQGDERKNFQFAADVIGWPDAAFEQAPSGEYKVRYTEWCWKLWQVRAAIAAENTPTANAEPFQQRVQPWMTACFGEMIAGDREQRNHRFLEEALELVQSTGCTASEAHQLVDYVYGRPVGEPAQEVGGIMVTLAALCLANDLDMHTAAETELARIWTKVEQIRAKQAAKPKHSPLPEAAPQQHALAPDLFKVKCWLEGEDGVLCEARAGASEIKDPDHAFVRLSAVLKLVGVQQHPQAALSDERESQTIAQLRKSLAGWQEECNVLRDDRDTLRQRLDLQALHQKNDVWYWQGDRTDYPESISNSMAVVIRGDQLRAILATRQPAPVSSSAPAMGVPHEEILKHRAEGRLEALQIILTEDPENPFSKCIDGSVSPATGEYDSWWDDKKLRALLQVDDLTDSPFDRAEIAYIDAMHERDEAKYARNFVENMNGAAKVRAALEKAGEYDLIAHLCTTTPPPHTAQGKALSQEVGDIKTWQKRLNAVDPSTRRKTKDAAKDAEIAELRAALAQRAASQPDSELDSALRSPINDALRTSQTGQGSYGPNYDGQKLATAVRTALQGDSGDGT